MFPSLFNRIYETKIPSSVNSFSSSLFEDDNFFETASRKPLKPQVPSEEEDEEEVVRVCLISLHS